MKMLASSDKAVDKSPSVWFRICVPNIRHYKTNYSTIVSNRSNRTSFVEFPDRLNQYNNCNFRESVHGIEYIITYIFLLITTKRFYTQDFTISTEEPNIRTKELHNSTEFELSIRKVRVLTLVEEGVTLVGHVSSGLDGTLNTNWIELPVLLNHWQLTIQGLNFTYLSLHNYCHLKCWNMWQFQIYDNDTIVRILFIWCWGLRLLEYFLTITLSEHKYVWRHLESFTQSFTGRLQKWHWLYDW